MSFLDRVLTRVENVLAAGSLGLAAAIAVAGVLSRYLFGHVLFWSEEAIIYLVICSTFFGAVITLRKGEHVNVDLLPILLKKRGKRVMAVLAALMLLVYLGSIGFFAWLLIFSPTAADTLTPSMKLPLWVVELAIPIGFTLMFVRGLQILYRVVRDRPAYPDKDETVLDAEVSTLDGKEDGR